MRHLKIKLNLNPVLLDPLTIKNVAKYQFKKEWMSKTIQRKKSIECIQLNSVNPNLLLCQPSWLVFCMQSK